MNEVRKLRLDQLALERGLFQSRSQAQAAIMAGEIFSESQLMNKPGHMVKSDIPLSFKSRRPKFASRAGYKMEGALRAFALEVRDLACVDVGSSTGGFTDCLLQQGAGRVCCVDVGKNQLISRLREDQRVQVMEGVNARHLTPQEVPGPFDLAVIDVSFISLLKIFPAVASWLRPDGRILALIKPQFEVGPAAIGRGGIVKDKKAQDEAVARVKACLEELGFSKTGVKPSCLKGMDGNQEFFVLAEGRKA